MLGHLRLPEPQPAPNVVHRTRPGAQQLDYAKSIGFA
jgi:hypothetical protein